MCDHSECTRRMSSTRYWVNGYRICSSLYGKWHREGRLPDRRPPMKAGEDVDMPEAKQAAIRQGFAKYREKKKNMVAEKKIGMPKKVKREETMEELEALIASRYDTMPKDNEPYRDGERK